MDKQFEKYKGIHPGLILARELKKRSIRQRQFALLVAEHPQTFNAITKGKRGITTAFALKVEKALNIEEGTLVLLQAFYDIKREKEKMVNHKPDLSILRNALFWDTDIKQIDWDRQYIAVIRRVFERGNDEEKSELIRFYGKAKVNSVLNSSKAKSNILQSGRQ